jgi:hypothetical protein
VVNALWWIAGGLLVDCWCLVAGMVNIHGDEIDMHFWVSVVWDSLCLIPACPANWLHPCMPCQLAPLLLLPLLLLLLLLPQGTKVSVNDFVMRAAALALRDTPQANAFWDAAAGVSVQQPSVDVCVAVATDGGLITPIVKAADTKSLTQVRSHPPLHHRHGWPHARIQYSHAHFSLSPSAV